MLGYRVYKFPELSSIYTQSLPTGFGWRNPRGAFTAQLMHFLLQNQPIFQMRFSKNEAI